MRFKDKVCVITGGANGIGACMVKEFAKGGARTAFIDIDRAGGERMLENILSSGGTGMFFHGDIADENVLKAFAEKVIKEYHKVDILINNACISRRGILSGCSYDDFNYVLKVGIAAPYMLTKLFCDYFADKGSVVNIASTRAFMSQCDTESYSAAKGGIIALTHALAVSLSGRVRVNSISPGWIDTNANTDPDYEKCHSRGDRLQHPAGRVGNPMDIARAVMFLCDEENGFITGENLTVDGGMTKLMIYHNDYGWTFDDQTNL
jgi:NAD(P)-dependent dehydrogenase (short-subunit alcohol dehydrogenase family)